MFDFDKLIERRNTDACKWDEVDKSVGNTDLIHLSVADTDFETAPHIKAELAKVVEHGIYGYTCLSDKFYTGIMDWQRKRHGVIIEREHICFTPRINIACGLCVEAFTKRGDSVVLNSPAYPPLVQAVVDNGRKVIAPCMKQVNGRFVFDLEEMAAQITPDTKMMVLVNPHNPTTRVFTREELEGIAELCVRHKLILFVDEIHSDVIASDKKFVSSLELQGQIQEQLIVASSVAKTFNVPGAIIAYLIIRNPELKAAFEKELNRIGEHNPNVFANAIMRVAYQEGEDYVRELNAYIEKNCSYLASELTRLFPKSVVHKREGSFLMWVDFNAYGIEEAKLFDFFTNDAKVGLYKGSHFGKEFSGFMRINIACPQARLAQVIERIEQAKAKSSLF